MTEWNWDDALAVRYDEGHEDGYEDGYEKGVMQVVANKDAQIAELKAQLEKHT